MDPSLHDFESFLAKDVRKWVEKYDELKKYGPAIEAKNVTGRVLLEASANAIKEDLGMTALHADFLKGKVSKIMEAGAGGTGPGRTSGKHEAGLSKLQDTLKLIQSQLEEQKRLFEEKFYEAEFMVPPRVMKSVEESVFLLMEEEGSTTGVGVGAFFASNFAVTADHNLRKFPYDQPGTSVYAECNGKPITLSIYKRDKKLDYALLKFDGTHTYLVPYTGSLSTLMSRQVALCAFPIGITEYLTEFQTSDVGVMPASIVKVSRQGRHLVLKSDTWPGDSGGAVVLHNGCLVGIHLAGVNALREKIKHEALDEATWRAEVASSLESAANSVATGCIALYVGAFTPFTSDKASKQKSVQAGTHSHQMDELNSAQAKPTARRVRMRGCSGSSYPASKAML